MGSFCSNVCTNVGRLLFGKCSLSFFSGVEVGKDQEFTVDTKGAGGQGKLEVKLTSPSRKVIPSVIDPVPGKEASTVKYIPKEEGVYNVDVNYDGHPVPGSPYTVEATLPPDPTKASQNLLNVHSLQHLSELCTPL